MNIPTIKRKIKFDAGHRLLDHEGKCANLHGHEYKCWVHARATSLDDLGMVIDFSILKEKIGSWIDQYFDHNFIVYEKDVDLINLISNLNQEKKPFILPYNPTSENIAKYLLYEVCPKLLIGTEVEIYKIELWETENSCAEIEL